MRPIGTMSLGVVLELALLRLVGALGRLLEADGQRESNIGRLIQGWAEGRRSRLPSRSTADYLP